MDRWKCWVHGQEAAGPCRAGAQRRWSLWLSLRLVVAIASGLPGLILPAQSTQAADRARFSYADLWRLRSVENVQISPDGQRIAYVVSAMDPQRDQPTQSLWVFRVADKHTAEVLLPHPGSAAWSPDGRRLAVVSQDPHGKSTVALLRPDDLQVEQTFGVSSAPEGLAWSPDGTSLAFSAFVPDSEAPSFLEKAVASAEADLDKPSGAQWAAPVHLTQASRYRQDGGTWFEQAGHQHLFVLSTKTGTLRQVGAGPFDDTKPAWMPDSATLLFLSDRRAEREHTLREPLLYKTDLEGRHVVQLVPNGSAYDAPSASPDGQWIAYTAQEVRMTNYTRNSLYLMRPDGTAVHRLAESLDRDVTAPQWTPDAHALYAGYDDHGLFRVGLFDLQGGVKEAASGVEDGWSVSQAGAIAYAGSTPVAPSELKLQRRGGEAVTLTANNEFLRQRELGHLLALEVRSSADATPVQAWALLPAGASEQTRLPTIVSLHGGPFGSDGPNWNRAFQLYAAAGYAVISVNYRGSTSYGSSFSEPANHNFPGLAYDDIMSVVEACVRRGLADPQRLFVTGGSAGGELTAWITGRTNRFRAAAAVKPVIDLLSDAMTTDQYLASPNSAGGLPWTREKELWAHSPLSLAGSMQTPMLLIVGEEDYRTSLDQTLALYDALQLRNVPTALMRVPDAGHESLASRPSHQAAEIAATLAWFHQYDTAVRP